MLEGHGDGQEELPLGREEVGLGVGGNELADGGAEQPPGVAEQPAGAGTALLAQLGLPKVTRSIPSSSLAPLVTLPLSTRGRAISRL